MRHVLSTRARGSRPKLSIKATLKARRRRRRILWSSALVAVIAVILVAYLITASFNDPYASYIGTPVSSSLHQELAGFSSTILADVGKGSAVAPSTISGSALTSSGKPEVLYIGGEFCPYCAVTRWSMIIAFSKFGNFTGLQYMLSSGSDVNPNTPTFTFANSSYTSSYVSFVAVEHYDRSQNIYQPLTTDENSLWTQYDSSGGIPFVDFGNNYLVTGTSGGIGQIDLAGMNWTQVMTQLNTPGSTTSQAILGEANYFISAVCALDGNQPSSVCSQPNATLTLAYTSAGPSGSTSTLMAVPPDRFDSQ